MRKAELLKKWTNGLSKENPEIQVDVTEIPEICNPDGTLKKTYCYNHGYYFHYKNDPVCKAYTDAGFSYAGYDEKTKIMTLRRSVCPVSDEMSDRSCKDSAVSKDMETDVEEPKEEQKDGILTQKQDNNLKVIKVGDLKDKRFYIPDYQRGYRWLDEAKYFVKDIRDCQLDEYLFQPLVVRKIDSCKYGQFVSYTAETLPEISSGECNGEGIYELIDGQQRLTTLFLVLNSLKIDPEFALYYENSREIDNLYIKLAQEKISEEIKSAGVTLKDNLLNKARFVWYEDQTERKPEDVFKSLNASKTELTSAELFKALLLHINDSSLDNTRISFQLDGMEAELNDEDLWRFISDNQSPSNRAELIFDIFAYRLNKVLCGNNRTSTIAGYVDAARGLNEGGLDSKYAFLSFDNFVEALKVATSFPRLDPYRKYLKDSQACWEDIYDIFEIIKSWHADYETHNLIGFLLATKGLSYFDRIGLISDLIDKQRESDHEAFIEDVYEKIRDKIKINNEKPVIVQDPDMSDDDNISYEKGQRSKCYNILLLINIWCAYRGKMHFNFKCLKDKYTVDKEHKQLWDIEHIVSRKENNSLLEIQKKGETYHTVDGDITGDGRSYITHVETIISELEAIRPEITNPVEQIDLGDLLTELKKSSDQVCPDHNLNEKVKTIWKNCAGGKSEDHAISNLTLLSSDINRSYHNAFYNEKCLIIQKKDEEGAFIPTVTKRIFSSRMYTDGHVWDKGAQKRYREELRDIIDEIWRGIKYE